MSHILENKDTSGIVDPRSDELVENVGTVPRKALKFLAFRDQGMSMSDP